MFSFLSSSTSQISPRKEAVLFLLVLALFCCSASTFAQTTVTIISPAKHALAVSSSTDIQVTFSAAMLTSSFTSSSFVVSGNVSGRHTGSFTFSGGNTIATFNPTNDFKRGEVVTVDVSSNVKDAGNASITPLVSQFTISSVASTGTYATKVDYATESNPYSVYASDIDGDGDGDILVANFISSTVSVLKNNGDGTYQTKVDYATGTQPVSVYASDIDGDGDGDILTANFNSHTVSVLKNNGNGTYQTKVDYATGVNPFSVYTSDIDGDGDADILVANYGSHTVSVLKNISNTFIITASSGANGSISPTGVVNVISGANQSFTITPNTGYHVDSVIVDDVKVDSTSSYTFTNVSAAHTIVAYFSVNTYTLTLNAENGSVVKDPEQANYNHGTSVELKATPATGYHFVNWSGDVTGTENPDTLTMDGNKTVTANFAINTYTLSVSGDYGIVTKDPNQESFDHGTTAQVSQTPDRGYIFTGWSGGASGTDNPLTVTMNGNKVIQANYSVDPDYEVLYRTAKYEDWATAKDGKNKLKSVKRKADKVFFKFNLTRATESNILLLDFGMEAVGAIT